MESLDIFEFVFEVINVLQIAAKFDTDHDFLDQAKGNEVKEW